MNISSEATSNSPFPRPLQHGECCNRQTLTECHFISLIPLFSAHPLATALSGAFNAIPSKKSLASHAPRSTMHRLLICVVLAVLLVTTLSASCPKSSCASWDASLPVFWLNTSTMNTRIHGPVITFYARQPNGEAYTHMPAGLAINYLGEVETHAAFGNCSGHTASGGLMTTLAEFQAESRVARYLNLSEACCDVIHKTGEPVNGAPGVTVESYIVNITHPAYPDFYAEYIASTPDTSYTIEKPGTEEIGSGYNITSEYVWQSSFRTSRPSFYGISLILVIAVPPKIFSMHICHFQSSSSSERRTNDPKFLLAPSPSHFCASSSELRLIRHDLISSIVFCCNGTRRIGMNPRSAVPRATVPLKSRST